jgi:hypothetical protein
MLIAMIERKLKAYGLKKVIPDDKLLDEPACGESSRSAAGACSRSRPPPRRSDRICRRYRRAGGKGSDHDHTDLFASDGDSVKLGLVASLNRWRLSDEEHDDDADHSTLAVPDSSCIYFLLLQTLSRRHKFVTLPIRRQCAERGSDALRRKILRELGDIATSADELKPV